MTWQIQNICRILSCVNPYTSDKFRLSGSVADPNTLNLDPDPGLRPNLDPDPGLYYQF